MGIQSGNYNLVQTQDGFKITSIDQEIKMLAYVRVEKHSLTRHQTGKGELL